MKDRKLATGCASIRHERECPFCTRTAVYKTEVGLRRAIARGSRCLSCSRNKDYDILDRVKEAHGLGLSNRKIAEAIGRQPLVVADYLKLLGLQPNIPRPRPLEMVDDQRARCRTCLKVKLVAEFPTARTSTGWSGACKACKSAAAATSIMTSPESYFAFRQQHLRANRRHRGIKVDLPDGYLAALWRAQAGKCFYTAREMTFGIGRGHGPSWASIDRADISREYVVGNVVLCQYRINAMKQDATLDEMRLWMPAWYDRIRYALPELNNSLVLVADTRPRNRAGRLLPAQYAKSHEVLQAYMKSEGVG